MDIERDRKGDKVSLMMQKGCLKKVLQNFNINGYTKSVSTPFTPHFKLKVIIFPTSVEECKYMTHVLMLARMVV